MLSKTYRPDIDGLRAIAVISVVLFHVRTGLFQGGYVGVDVFFVISGYLITGIIHEDLIGGRFSVARFYERRIRRIFPALFAVFIGSTALGAALLLPSEFVEFARSLLATTFFVSNVYFSTQTGYLATGVEMKPLLHMWSLSVEEQFYVIFPLLLAVAFRFWRSGLRFCVATLAVASFAFSVFLVSHDPDSAFYSAPARAWELMLGSLVALGTFQPIRHRVTRECLGAIGIILVAGSAIVFRTSTTFPGVAALAPTVGAALLIFSAMHERTMASRLLGNRVLVWFGLISYSLYLWHWPIIVFSRFALGHDLTKVEKVLVGGASVLVATLSWRFIERPWRRPGSIVVWPRLAFVSAAVVLAFVAVSSAVVTSAGAPMRFSERVDRLASYEMYDTSQSYRQGKCFLLARSVPGETLDMKQCMSADTHRPNFLLLGDSHAADLWYGLTTAFPEIHFMQATAIGCKPLLNDRGPNPCRNLMQSMLRRDVATAKPDAVLLSSDWTSKDLSGLLETIAYLRKTGTQVYILGQVPEYQFDLSRLLAMAVLNRDDARVTRGRIAEAAEVDRAFTDGLSKSGATYLSLYRLICKSEAECTTLIPDDVPLQFDTSHFTQAGSLWVAQHLRSSEVLGQRLHGQSEATTF